MQADLCKFAKPIPRDYLSFEMKQDAIQIRAPASTI